MDLPQREGPTGQDRSPSTPRLLYWGELSWHKILPMCQASCWGVRHELGKISDNFLPCVYPSAAITLGCEPGIEMHLEAEAERLQVQGQMEAWLRTRASVMCERGPGFHHAQ